LLLNLKLRELHSLQAGLSGRVKAKRPHYHGGCVLEALMPSQNRLGVSVAIRTFMTLSCQVGVPEVVMVSSLRAATHSLM